jgi:hypothetical protein
MSQKVLYPTYGSQSITAVMKHLETFNMTVDARAKLAQEIMRRFKSIQFVITFNPATGEIEDAEQLKLWR